jgi:hypothetical protein
VRRLKKSYVFVTPKYFRKLVISPNHCANLHLELRVDRSQMVRRLKELPVSVTSQYFRKLLVRQSFGVAGDAIATVKKICDHLDAISQ